MKIRIVILLSVLLAFSSCQDLDLNPLSEGSTETWYSTETEIRMALNDLFRPVFWPRDNDQWTDDWMFRGETNAMTAGTITAETGTVVNNWRNTYKAISRSIRVIENIDRMAGQVPEESLNKYEANARFVLASSYAYLIARWGDVPYYEKTIMLDEAFEMGRTPKADILQHIYSHYDFAATHLPLSYGSSENQYATRGAALAMKARIALYMGDFATARDAAKGVMDLGVYQLYPSYRELFLPSTKNSIESIFVIPQSVELGFYDSNTRYYITRLAGGWGSWIPTYDLMAAYLCTDGLPIDESPLFNPRNPWENRDPRWGEVSVEFGTEWLGFTYQPHPDSLEVMNHTTGVRVRNMDTRSNAAFASFNGLVTKKGVDESYTGNFMTDPDLIYIRYADVLLMYAEAKIELNEIDASARDAMNRVRARAYQVGVGDTHLYPAITANNQVDLRRELRIERRMELALEGLRYMDLIRWRLSEKAINRPHFGLLDTQELRTRVVNQNLWFLPGIPVIDEDHLPDFSAIYNAGRIKLLSNRSFDASKQYLWPIPAKEILINPNLTQNPNY
jgi:starch-binding outer membrane protein, SusD/RagB family